MSKRKRKRKSPLATQSRGSDARRAEQSKTSEQQRVEAAAANSALVPISKPLRVGVAAALLIAGVISYFPNLVHFAERWSNEPDYSHGFFVLPFIGYCLFVRRQEFPAPSPTLAWGGLVLLTLGAICRVVGGGIYIDAVEDWSFIVWVAGCVWLIWGWRTFVWSLPFVAFLFFMIPLPFSLEEGMALPLQRIATKISTWTLQAMGQPAFGSGEYDHIWRQHVGGASRLLWAPYIYLHDCGWRSRGDALS